MHQTQNPGHTDSHTDMLRWVLELGWRSNCSAYKRTLQEQFFLRKRSDNWYKRADSEADRVGVVCMGKHNCTDLVTFSV